MKERKKEYGVDKWPAGPWPWVLGVLRVVWFWLALSDSIQEKRIGQPTKLSKISALFLYSTPVLFRFPQTMTIKLWDILIKRQIQKHFLKFMSTIASGSTNHVIIIICFILT